MEHIGRRTILPTSHTAQPGAMNEHHLDAMTTFNCDPNQPENTSSLLDNLTAADQPDPVYRVFYSKVKQLLEDITQGKIFGQVTKHVAVFEFQKKVYHTALCS